MTKRKYLSHIEIERMISAVPDGANGCRDRCMLLMCFIHGLRVSELRGLRLEDIDLATNRLHVSRLKNGFSVQHPIQIRERIALAAGWQSAQATWNLIAPGCFFLATVGKFHANNFTD
jgi:type 1 fimbriae regulatory protein FimB